MVKRFSDFDWDSTKTQHNPRDSVESFGADSHPTFKKAQMVTSTDLDLVV